MERVLDTIQCKTVVLRTTNIWGAEVVKNRVNGLVDKLRAVCNSDEVVEIYADLETRVDLIHLKDFNDLLLKVIDCDLENKHEMFIIGGQSISICDIINRVSRNGSLNLRIDQKAEKTYLRVSSTKAETTFGWKRNNFL